MKVFNKRARFDYSLLERYEAGIVLSGAEVKAIKDGGLNLNQAHARVIDGEVFLVNANISLKSNQSTRSRKLMLHKKEITSIQSKGWFSLGQGLKEVSEESSKEEKRYPERSRKRDRRL